MDVKTGFQRSFLIFVNEDAGYETGQKPSGHVKQEVREGKGKLYAAVQNLRPGNGRFVYQLYLIKADRDEAVSVYAGQLVPEHNKAVLEWNFNPRDVGTSGYRIEEFSCLVVLAEYSDKPGDAIICPLAAYRDRKVEWRNSLKAHLRKKKMEIQPGAGAIADDSPAQWKPIMQPMQIDQLPQTMETDLPQEQQPSEPLLSQKHLPQVQLPPEQQPAEPLLTNEKQPQEQLPQYQLPLKQESSEPLLTNEQQPQNHLPQYQLPSEQLPPEQLKIPMMDMPETVYQPLQDQPLESCKDNLLQINTGCVYLNGNMCGALVKNSTAVNPCNSCHMHHWPAQQAVTPVGDVSRLKEELNRYFEINDPFHSKRSDYMWWKVTNPVNLNNLLYQCNIRSPLLFNPVVMMAHYKYRHLIIGIFQDKGREKQYVVCGVPGMHMVDKKPFGEMSRWVQVEGNRVRYGAFGYWLVYINPNDGKILNMSLE